MANESIVVIAATLILVGGPVTLSVAGLVRARHQEHDAISSAKSWNWKLSVISMLCYTLAFNLTFFIQELFLVLPKALTPGLRPTLFHNNHTWEGENALANLYQGTGALATIISGLTSALLLRRSSGASVTTGLFLFWMAYSGLFMALPQFVVAAISPQADVGMAMAYLGCSSAAKTAVALAALVAIPTIALWFRRPLLLLAPSQDQLANAGARTRFAFKIVTLPSLLAILMIIPFRLPRESVEVVMVPAVVTLLGIVWIQAGVWRTAHVTPAGRTDRGSITWLLCAVMVLFLTFQLLLRPGIRFY